MKVGRLIGLVGGGLIALALVVIVVVGSRTPDAQSFLAPAGQSVTALWDRAREILRVPTTPAAGNATLAFGFAALGYVLTTLLASGARTGRGVAITAAVWGLVGLVLYMPGLTT